jgi:hypothetical protein
MVREAPYLIDHVLPGRYDGQGWSMSDDAYWGRLIGCMVEFVRSS